MTITSESIGGIIDHINSNIADKYGNVNGTAHTDLSDQGDLSGDYSNPRVAKIQNVPINLGSSVEGSVLTIDNGSIVPKPLLGDLISTGTAGRFQVTGIYGVPIDVVTENDTGKPLIFDGNSWKPGYPSENTGALGLEVDFETGACIRLGAAIGRSPGADFNVFPMYQRRRCMVLPPFVQGSGSSKVLGYRGDAGYTEEGAIKEDVIIGGETYIENTAVFTMVEQPKFYYKIEIARAATGEAGKGRARFWISSTALDGFSVFPAFKYKASAVAAMEIHNKIYLSAFEAGSCTVSAGGIATYNTDNSTINETVSRLCSIAGIIPFTGENNPDIEISDIRTMASKVGNGWQPATLWTRACTLLLAAIEFGTFDLKRHLGNIGEYTPYEDPVIPETNKTGMSLFCGDQSSTPREAEKFGFVSYRGEENIYGNVATLIDGVTADYDGSNITIKARDDNNCNLAEPVTTFSEKLTESSFKAFGDFQYPVVDSKVIFTGLPLYQAMDGATNFISDRGSHPVLTGTPVLGMAVSSDSSGQHKGPCSVVLDPPLETLGARLVYYAI